MKRKTTSYRAGLFAEFLARMYLRLHGFQIVKSRYITGRYTGRAEIDIIARKAFGRSKNLLLFVEVKNRSDAETAFSAITFAQNARLRAAAETYMLRTRWTGDSRFDVIVVSGRNAGCGRKVQWFKNAI